MNLSSFKPKTRNQYGESGMRTYNNNGVVSFTDIFIQTSAITDVGTYGDDVRIPLAKSMNSRVDFVKNINIHFLPALLELRDNGVRIFKQGPGLSLVPGSVRKRVSVQHTGKEPLTPNMIFTVIPPLTTVKGGAIGNDCMNVDLGNGEFGRVYPPETVEVHRFKKEINELLKVVNMLANVYKTITTNEMFTNDVKAPLMEVLAPIVWSRLINNSLFTQMVIAIEHFSGVPGNKMIVLEHLLDIFRDYWWPSMLHSETEGELVTISDVLNTLTDVIRKVDNNVYNSTGTIFISNPTSETNKNMMRDAVLAQTALTAALESLVMRLTTFEPVEVGHILSSTSSPIIRGQKMDIFTL